MQQKLPNDFLTKKSYIFRLLKNYPIGSVLYYLINTFTEIPFVFQAVRTLNMGIRPARISLCLYCAGLAARLYGLV